MRTFVITDDECDEINFVMAIVEAPEEADLDALFTAFVAEYGDGRGGLDAQRLRAEGYLSHEASRLFGDWLARRPGFHRLLFEELNTTLRLEDERARLMEQARLAEQAASQEG